MSDHDRAPWNLPLSALQRELDASSAGLTSVDAQRRLAKHGSNDALDRRARPLWRDIATRLSNPLVLILLFAASLSAATGERTSFALIVAIIAISVALDVSTGISASCTPASWKAGARSRTSPSTS